MIALTVRRPKVGAAFLVTYVALRVLSLDFVAQLGKFLNLSVDKPRKLFAEVGDAHRCAACFPVYPQKKIESTGNFHFWQTQFCPADAGFRWVNHGFNLTIPEGSLEFLVRRGIQTTLGALS